MVIKERSLSTEVPGYLFAKGYCKERVLRLDFDRYFTDEEKKQNLEFANTHSDEEVAARCKENAKETHELLMRTAALFKAYDIHQFSPETSTMAHYNSDWDLFWYSNKGWNFTNLVSYCSLTFNPNRDEKRNKALRNEIVELLSSSGISQVCCTVVTNIEWNEEKLAEDAARFVEKLNSKSAKNAPCSEVLKGKIKPVEGGYGFFKKHAKTVYTEVSNLDVVKLYHEIFPNEKLNFDLDHDAVFLPGTIHGCADELYIIYENPQANEGRGSIEIEIVDYETLLEIYEKTGDNAVEFFGIMPDYFHGRWYYCDNSETDEERRRDYEDYLRLYHQADFIEGTDGDLTDEFKFIINWAKARKNELTPKSKRVNVETKFGNISVEYPLTEENDGKIRIFDSNGKYIDYIETESIANKAEEKGVSFEEALLSYIELIKNEENIVDFLNLFCSCWDTVTNLIGWTVFAEHLKVKTREEVLDNEYVNVIGDSLILISEQ